MRGFSRKRWRAVVTVALAVWALGPWMPSIACALAQRDPSATDPAQAPAAAHAPVPKCHAHASQPPDTQRPEPRDARGASDCCKDVEGSCCLQAASITGAPSAEKRLDAPEAALTVFAAPLSASAVSALAATTRYVRPHVSPPLSRTSVLRL